MRYVRLFIFRHLFPQNNIFSSRIFWEESPYDTKLVVQIRPVKGHRNCFNEYLGKAAIKRKRLRPPFYISDVGKSIGRNVVRSARPNGCLINGLGNLASFDHFYRSSIRQNITTHYTIFYPVMFCCCVTHI